MFCGQANFILTLLVLYISRNNCVGTISVVSVVCLAKCYMNMNNKNVIYFIQEVLKVQTPVQYNRTLTFTLPYSKINAVYAVLMLVWIPG